MATRAKLCVLFYESNQVAAQPMLDLWQAQGVTVCREMGPEVSTNILCWVAGRQCRKSGPLLDWDYSRVAVQLPWYLSCTNCYFCITVWAALEL